MTICVDSRVGLKATESSKINSDTVLRCRTARGNMQPNAWLCWVSVHCNIEGNGKAYELARVNSQSTDEVSDSKPPFYQSTRKFHENERMPFIPMSCSIKGKTTSYEGHSTHDITVHSDIDLCHLPLRKKALLALGTELKHNHLRRVWHSQKQ